MAPDQLTQKMPNNLDQQLWQQFWISTFSGALGTLLASLVSFILVFWIFKPFKAWVYKQSSKLGDLLQSIINFISYPYLRLLVFVISLISLYFGRYKEITVPLSFIIFISFFDKRNRFYKLSSPSTSFSDDFQNSKNELNKDKWLIKTGKPEILPTIDNGHPRLSLPLSIPPEATNSFLLAKTDKVERGIVECDVYLSPDSVFNIVFYCDEKNDNWHMARYEGRHTESNAFLIKDKGPGANWRFNKILGARTNPTQWHRVRVEFAAEKARMFCDGDLLGEITNLQMFGYKIGFFNECGEVLVGNFSISRI